MAAVNFFSQDVPFTLPNPRKTSNWIKKALQAEKRSLTQLNFIFCSDEHLLDINIQYLKHNTYTDIITFDNSESSKTVEGDIFISIERVEENAKKLSVPFIEELRRVIIHGVLHLIGYSDKGEAQIKVMRKKEDTYLSLW
jgi:probable rRNA maturation factor